MDGERTEDMMATEDMIVVVLGLGLGECRIWMGRGLRI